MIIDPGLLQLAAIMLVMTPIMLLLVLTALMTIPRRVPEVWVAAMVKVGVSVTIFSLLVLGLKLFLSTDRAISFAPMEKYHLGAFHFQISYYLDRMGFFFALLALGLAFTISFFSQKYMHRDPGYLRFFTFYSLFVAGMILVTLAGSVETLFIGWELVGLSSALLVAFFQERAMPARNAFHLWIVYRVADVALFIAMFFLHKALGEVVYPPVFPDQGKPVLDPTRSMALFLAGCMITLSAMGKSALIPFCGWLSRAMDGPTPSSAIFYGAISIHMGAFLLLRMNPILQFFPILSWALVGLGIATSILSAIIEKTQCDMKSILAFATLTQVGIIVAEIGMGWETLAILHIIGHASLRAYQFLHAPSSFQHYRTLQESLGSYSINKASIQEVPLPFWNHPAVYRVGFHRGGLDTFLNQCFIGPFLSCCRLLHRMEQNLFCPDTQQKSPVFLKGRGEKRD